MSDVIRLQGGRWIWPEEERAWMFVLRDEGWEVYVAQMEGHEYGIFYQWNGVFPSRGHALRACGLEP